MLQSANVLPLKPRLPLKMLACMLQLAQWQIAVKV
jgi:hypothetical protein